MFFLPVIDKFVRKLVQGSYLGSIELTNEAKVDYIHFGNKGPILLVILGLGDGVRTAKDISVLLYLYFFPYARKKQVIIVSRRRPLSKEVSTEELANDFAYVLEKLNLNQVYIWGSSAGGPIAQSLALKEANRIKGLILSKTLCRSDTSFYKKLQIYIDQAKEKKFYQFISDFLVIRLNDNQMKFINVLFFKIARIIMRKYGEERVYYLLSSFQSFNQYDNNKYVNCPVLVLVEKNDTFVPTRLQEELGESFTNATVVVGGQKGEGHSITLSSYLSYFKNINCFIELIENK